MSRLIFEGDTTERFGKLFPKPFVEEIKIFNEIVETKIALFFKIPVEDSEAQKFIDKIGDYNLYLKIAVASEILINEATNTNNFFQATGEARAASTAPAPKAASSIATSAPAMSDKLSTRSTSSRLGGSAPRELREESDILAYQEIPFSEFTSGNSNVEFDSSFYNSTGERFLKIQLAVFFGIDVFQSRNRNGAYIVCFTHEERKGNPQYTETSDLSIEKVFNADGTISVEREPAYLQADGNYYNSIPLMSLDRNYRKTDAINHSEVMSRIQAVIQPFVGSMEEANLISATLSQNASDPKLLIRLQRNINKFPNKSTATVGGSLYGQLVDEISDIDNTLVQSGLLQKRLLDKNKIKNMGIFSYTNIERSGSASSTSRSVRASSLATKYFSKDPLIYRYLSIGVPSTEFSDEDDAYITTDIYNFFDYEKTLNYKSEISAVFNPYNILELFGNNCLNQRFAETHAQIELTRNDEFNLFNFDQAGKRSSYIGISSIYQNQYTFYQGTEPYEFQRMFCERGLDTAEGLNGYRLKCYELNYSKPYSDINSIESMKLIINVTDSTMAFYDNQIRRAMLNLKTPLNEYYEYASQFCSYNNIDGKFNDFFVDAMESHFQQPYPWDTAPLYYASMLALLRNSWNYDSIDQNTGVPSLTTRKKDGTALDLQEIKKVATNLRNLISPRPGDLTSLEHFNYLFNELYSQIFSINGALDTKCAIYESPTSDSLSLLSSLRAGRVEKQFTSRSTRIDTTPVDVDYKITNPGGSDIDYLIPKPFVVGATFPSLPYEEALDYLVNFASGEWLQVDFTISQSSETSAESVIREGTRSITEFINENVTPNTDGFKTTDMGKDKANEILEEFVSQALLAVKGAGSGLSGAVRVEPIARWKDQFYPIQDARDQYRSNVHGSEHVIKKTKHVRTEATGGKTYMAKHVREMKVRVTEESINLFLQHLFGAFYTYSYEVGEGSNSLGEAEPIDLDRFVELWGIK